MKWFIHEKCPSSNSACPELMHGPYDGKKPARDAIELKERNNDIGHIYTLMDENDYVVFTLKRGLGSE